MAALVDIYVDPSLNSNTGAGTEGDPYGDLQYALNTHTRDLVDGNQINIKDAAAEVLAAPLDFTTYWGTPTATVPTVIRGYRTTKNDGYKAIIDASGGAAFPALTFLQLRDLHIHNGGSSTLVTGGSRSAVINCKIENTSGIGVLASGGLSIVQGCEITDCGSGLDITGTGIFTGNYLKSGATRDFTQAINYTVAGGVVILRNIISVGSSGDGIRIGSSRLTLIGNSIFANGSAGRGIYQTSNTALDGGVILNNVVEGFSGEGGSGFNFATATSVPMRYAGNAAFGNDVDYRNPGDVGIADDEDNEVLTASPFAKTGADTFANRFAYFSPVDTGNIRGGAIQ